MKTQYDIVVIGSGPAGVKAATIIKENDKDRSVLIITKDPFTYTKMALHHVLKKELPIDFFKIYPDLDNLKISFTPSTEVGKIDLKRKLIKVKSPHKDSEYTFNKLILAVGSKPIIPNIEGIDKIGVFTFNELNDATSINKYIKVGMKAIITGAGLVGLLLSEALRARGLDVTLIDKLPGVGLTIFEEEISSYLVGKLMSRGVKIITESSIEKLVGDRKNRKIVKKVVINGDRYLADVVFFTLGVKPENRLALRTDIKLGVKRAIKTDERLETSIPDVYAVGDCATSIDYFTKKETYRPLGTLAVSMAEIAGKNCVNISTSYNGFIPMQYIEVFNTSIVKIGLNTKEAKELGLKTSKKMIRYKVPGIGHHPVSLLICQENRQENIIGWQAVSPWLASYKSTIFINAIRERIGLSEFQDMEKNIEVVG
ncbi:MAG: FAD-dependent oxidoreductase [Aigarchaeota archaeon]|nr:FAD-dependent oxidoreductase [Aigarchaeota archaeon]MCX8193570.1 FAD-dependent oxidoreductase [Nitrososphaeria archaeon]